MNKFTLLADLGTVTVPQDYCHSTAFSAFFERNPALRTEHNGEITDVNFSNPSRILKPGDTFLVSAYHDSAKSTSHGGRMHFLESQNAALIGAQGTILIWEQKLSSLPKGNWYFSLDKDGCLPELYDERRVPFVAAWRKESPSVGLFQTGGMWDPTSVLLCFREVRTP
jgi:hypothetical protein